MSGRVVSESGACLDPHRENTPQLRVGNLGITLVDESDDWNPLLTEGAEQPTRKILHHRCFARAITASREIVDRYRDLSLLAQQK